MERIIKHKGGRNFMADHHIWNVAHATVRFVEPERIDQ
jgi:hypothetical protein